MCIRDRTRSVPVSLATLSVRYYRFLGTLLERLSQHSDNVAVNRVNSDIATNFLLRSLFMYAIEPNTRTITLPNTIPVSYTHLDVYKRQLLLCTPFSGQHDLYA